MPRRYYKYLSIYDNYNIISTFGSIINVLSMILFFYIIYRQLTKKERFSSKDQFNRDPIYKIDYHHYIIKPIIV